MILEAGGSRPSCATCPDGEQRKVAEADLAETIAPSAGCGLFRLVPSPSKTRARACPASAATPTATPGAARGRDRTASGREILPHDTDGSTGAATTAGLIFIDLRDRTGLVQLVFNPDAAGAAQELGHGFEPRT